MKIRDRVLVCLYFFAAVLPFAAMKLGAHDHEINGRLPPAPYPVRSFAAFRDETFQKAYTAWFESKLGFKGYSIATDNSILYHLFGETKAGSTLRLGEDGVIFNDEDIAYYNKDGKALPGQRKVDALAQDLADLQNLLKAQHRAFVPVIIPSKTTIWRDHIKAQWARDLGEPRPSDAKVYGAFIAALDAHKVRYVDARALFLSGKYPRDLLWGKNARHWSYYGACLVMQEVVRAYADLSGKPPLPYECPVEQKKQGISHDDFDLWRLLNVWHPRRPDRVIPVIDHVPPAAPGAYKPSILIVGTSFCWTLLKDAGRTGLFGVMHMDYYDKLLVSWPQDIHTEIHPHTPEWRDVFLNKDLYVLDLYEGYLLPPDDSYVNTFLKDVGMELFQKPSQTGPTSGATIGEVKDLGIADGGHHFELWGSFPNPDRPYSATVICDGVQRTASVYYQNANGQQLNVRIDDPGAGACDPATKRAAGVTCTFHVEQGTTIGSPTTEPRHVCPGPQGQSGQDPDGRCAVGLGGC